MRTTAPLALGLLLAAAHPAPAQAERYELGRRVKRFEAEWERQTDPAARKRALAVVERASGLFLLLRLGEAARAVDEAWWELRSEGEPDALTLWALSLYPEPEARAVDATRDSVKVTVKSLYRIKAEVPAGSFARLWVGVGKEVDVGLDKLPVVVDVPCRTDNHNGEFRLYLALLHPGSGNIPAASVGFSTVKDAKAHLEAVRKAAAGRPPLEAATLADRCELLGGLLAGDVPETDHRATELLGEARSIVLAGGWYFTADRGGNFRLSVPAGADRRTPCRLFVPNGLDATKPVPLVVALHGAGGSENLFFEGYGNGHIVKECEKRGWLLVAPRGGGLLGGTPPVAEIVAKLGERYPIDPRRVFLIGHSLGAAQAVELVQQHPGRFAAAACLGGGGRVRKPEAFAELPLFIGIGSKDFALRGAKALHKSLADAGAKRATFREYPDLEHLLIVREALPDVFVGFDEAAR